MVQIRLSSILLIAGSLWLSGCATPGKATAISTTTPPSSAAASKLGGAQPGDLIELPADNIFGEPTIVIGEDYTAASGRLCRRLRSESGGVLSRIICQYESGEWYSPRSLESNSRTSTSTYSQAVPSSQAAAKTPDADLIENGSVVVVDLAQEDLLADSEKVRTETPSVETSTHQLMQGETLWSFSRRITGNALNWKTIAELNAIDDSRRLLEGGELLVPKSLVRGEL